MLRDWRWDIIRNDGCNALGECASRSQQRGGAATSLGSRDARPLSLPHFPTHDAPYPDPALSPRPGCPDSTPLTDQEPCHLEQFIAYVNGTVPARRHHQSRHSSYWIRWSLSVYVYSGWGYHPAGVCDHCTRAVQLSIAVSSDPWRGRHTVLRYVIGFAYGGRWRPLTLGPCCAA